MHQAADYERLAERLDAQGIDVEEVKDRLKAQHIETPSWGYGNSGTRFKVYSWPGAARNIQEKLADAGYVQRLTGVAPTVALHIPWDKVDDWEGLAQFAAEQGVGIGAINPNVFQEEQYRLGSITNPSATVREEAVAHMVECCEIMTLTGSDLLSLWFADGSNYSGQDSMSDRKRRMEAALAETYRHLPASGRMLIEYKFFEPGFYHTDLADWGMAYATALKLGEQAQVLVDTGHHAQGTNIAHIVSFLLDEGRLGGFHFNARRYADDDLIVGTNNPFELFEIFCELVSAGSGADDVAYMIDQSHNIEPKLEAMVLSVVNCQTAFAKALLVDQEALQERQLSGDVLGGHAVLAAAFETDVRPLLAQARIETGRDPDPLAVLRADDYSERVARERGTIEASGGYPG
ncbi:MAG: L-rhamnose isomerase [Anaerolineaceae bacterium]|nr:L-rhamnose isomerase [Anaerolineaceae bacterium]MDE0329473.1 L-rhamnose isomerase [Anaerolineaceae bacterium]